MHKEFLEEEISKRTNHEIVITEPIMGTDFNPRRSIRIDNKPTNIKINLIDYQNGGNEYKLAFIEDLTIMVQKEIEKMNNTDINNDLLSRTVDMYIFGINNQETRDKIIKNLTKKYDDLKKKEKIKEYKFTCDDTNNTDEILIQNKLVLDAVIDGKNYHITAEPFKGNHVKKI